MPIDHALTGDPALTGDFRADLAKMLPRLRRYAMSLTRDADRANDLVQQTVLKSLTGLESFRPGTNFPGWLFRIERNEFISGLRRQRPTVELNDTVANTLSYLPQQESSIVMHEFKKAFRMLASSQRKALLLTALEGSSHKSIAALSRVSVGTVKSRVSRARTKLRQILDNEGGAFALPSRPPQGGHAPAVVQ